MSKATIIDPAEEAKALVFHMGREDFAKRTPIAPVVECVQDLRTAELEYIMQETPA